METVNIKVRDLDGDIVNVECVKDEHPNPYGNGSVVRMNSHLLEWNHALFDTRYISFDDFGGFEGFCKEQLRAKGFEVID